jgi:hypothetical protein
MEMAQRFHVPTDQAFKDEGVGVPKAHVNPQDLLGYIEPPQEKHVLSPSDARGPSPRRLLSAEVIGLSQSLDVTSPGNGDAYDPDAFLKAITARHDQLMEIKDKLLRQAVEQRDLASKLAEREAQVAFREKRVLAHERLLGQTAGRRSWLGFFSRS